MEKDNNSEKGNIQKILSVSLIVLAVVAFTYVFTLAKGLSYLSSDPKACINCHVMNTSYATWQHSSHSQVKCIECHLRLNGKFRGLKST